MIDYFIVVLVKIVAGLVLEQANTVGKNATKSCPAGSVKMLWPFLCTAPLQYVPKILFAQATIGCLTNNKTKNALHKETTIIKNHIGGDPISYSLSN